MSIKNLPADYLLAAQQGDIDKVKTCLALGVDINTCDRQGKTGNDSNLLIVFYVQIMPDDFVMQLHRF
ncbi:ankyrin [Escherichia coli]|nr:ankyrin [Escherichia coli]SQS40096.1 ankyrin [Escherichia coli]SRY41312.1 ankyrin [Escherichia coli]SRY76706.1 ankyrin [Escherichia coli]